MVDEFSSKYPNPDMWTGNEKDTPYHALKDHLQRYQNPEEADSIQKIYKELDETKDILVRDSLLDATLDVLRRAFKRSLHLESPRPPPLLP